MTHVVEVQNLKKTYGNTTEVADVSFSVARGEIFGMTALAIRAGAQVRSAWEARSPWRALRERKRPLFWASRSEVTRKQMDLRMPGLDGAGATALERGLIRLTR